MGGRETLKPEKEWVCETLIPRSSGWLRNPETLKEVVAAKPRNPTRSVWLRSPETLKGVHGCETQKP